MLMEARACLFFEMLFDDVKREICSQNKGRVLDLFTLYTSWKGGMSSFLKSRPSDENMSVSHPWRASGDSRAAYRRTADSLQGSARLIARGLTASPSRQLVSNKRRGPVVRGVPARIPTPKPWGLGDACGLGG